MSMLRRWSADQPARLPVLVRWGARLSGRALHRAEAERDAARALLAAVDPEVAWLREQLADTQSVLADESAARAAAESDLMWARRDLACAQVAARAAVGAERDRAAAEREQLRADARAEFAHAVHRALEALSNQLAQPFDVGEDDPLIAAWAVALRIDRVRKALTIAAEADPADADNYLLVHDELTDRVDAALVTARGDIHAIRAGVASALALHPDNDVLDASLRADTGVRA
jgi:hypothetical protein